MEKPKTTAGPERIPQRIVLLQDGEKESASSYGELLERFDVQGLVRIPAAEFDEIEGGRHLVGHFNLGATNHEPGSKYLIVKIIRNGVYRTATEPLLSLKGARVMRCVAAENNLSPDALTSHYFENSLRSIIDPSSLKRTLIQRYEASRGGLTEDDVESQGVAFTLFEPVE